MDSNPSSLQNNGKKMEWTCKSRHYVHWFHWFGQNTKRWPKGLNFSFTWFPGITAKGDCPLKKRCTRKANKSAHFVHKVKIFPEGTRQICSNPRQHNNLYSVTDVNATAEEQKELIIRSTTKIDSRKLKRNAVRHETEQILNKINSCATNRRHPDRYRCHGVRCRRCRAQWRSWWWAWTRRSPTPSSPF